MILWELLKVFVMALLGITGILLMAGIVAEAAQEGLGPAQVLAAIPLLIPSTLPYTIPATTLFACCVTYGRLAADNEILAIKSSGVNILMVTRPGLLLGLAMTGVTMSLYWSVIPYSHRLLRQLVFDDAEEMLYSMLRKQHSINFASMPFAMWVEGVDGRKLINPVIKKRNAQGKTEYTAVAKEAELHVDMRRRKIMIELTASTGTSPDGDTDVSLSTPRELEVDLPPTFGPDADRRARDMTWTEILEKRRRLEEADAAFKAKIAAAADRKAIVYRYSCRSFAGRRQMLAQISHRGGLLPSANPLVKCRAIDAAGPERGLFLLHLSRLSGRHLVQPQRLPQFLHHLFFADRPLVLPAPVVRHRHGQGRPYGPAAPFVGRKSHHGFHRRRPVLAAVKELREPVTSFRVRAFRHGVRCSGFICFA